jgi:hypothetical protein
VNKHELPGERNRKRIEMQDYTTIRVAKIKMYVLVLPSVGEYGKPQTLNHVCRFSTKKKSNICITGVPERESKNNY